MVGTARPEQYSIFLRKIGYTVGLERTLERFGDFAELYASVPQLTLGDWNRLVAEKWKLKTDNIADVFASLRIVEVQNGGVFPGAIGEAAAVALRLMPSTSERNRALQYLLALGITLSDGDIFLNFLSAGFKAADCEKNLVSALLAKRVELFRIFAGQAEQEAIASAIGIERQRSNRGGASKNRLAAHTTNVKEATKKLGLPTRKDVHFVEPISQDYFRHVIPARREWARSLGLVDGESVVTQLGQGWLTTFSDSGFCLPGGEYSLRPTCFELEQAGFQAVRELMDSCPSTWRYAVTVWYALGGDAIRPWADGDGAILAQWVRDLFSNYRELSQERRMIRNEVPILVAYAAYFAVVRAAGAAALDIGSWLGNDDPLSRGIKVRSSRVIETGLIAG
jgi:hypothetical protein